jgi:hypothetical protein
MMLRGRSAIRQTEDLRAGAGGTEAWSWVDTRGFPSAANEHPPRTTFLGPRTSDLSPRRLAFLRRHDGSRARPDDSLHAQTPSVHRPKLRGRVQALGRRVHGDSCAAPRPPMHVQNALGQVQKRFVHVKTTFARAPKAFVRAAASFVPGQKALCTAQIGRAPVQGRSRRAQRRSCMAQGAVGRARKSALRVKTAFARAQSILVHAK